jgi:hypothetical protein
VKFLVNTSLKDDIYSFLNGQASIAILVDQIGWGQMPDTAVTKKQIVYAMISDVRTPGSYLRNQRWRFWICFPRTGSNPKSGVMEAGNKLLDVLHNQRGTFGSTSIHYSENVSNQDPFFDTASNCYILIQDYNLKMKTLEV